jgi:hypothetical protein
LEYRALSGSIAVTSFFLETFYNGPDVAGDIRELFPFQLILYNFDREPKSTGDNRSIDEYKVASSFLRVVPLSFFRRS